MLAVIGFTACGSDYEPPRMADGRPSLQGLWTNSSITDLERPAQVDKLILSEADAATFAAEDDLVNRVVDDAKPTDPNAGLLDGSDLLAGRGYNAFWIDPGLQVGRVKDTFRSSWIVEPDNGRIPYSDNGREFLRSAAELRENYDGPEVRPLGERCLATTGRTGPPMINGLYNNNYQIVQTATHVMILSEMVQHARIVTLQNGPDATSNRHASVQMMFGDSVGWWDGDTLVVETVNFHPMHRLYPHPLFHTEQSKVTERFSRYADDELLYEFRVEDPNLYTQPWRGEARFLATEGPIFEYACHEGNYAMHGILAGARAKEGGAPTDESR